jgi:hypothetical protein
MSHLLRDICAPVDGARRHVSCNFLSTAATQQINCLMTTAVIIVSGIYFPCCGKQVTYVVTALRVIIIAMHLIHENSACSMSSHH